MDREYRIKRMQELISKNKRKIEMEYSPNFISCIRALGTKVVVLTEDESEQIYSKMQQDFPFTRWGRIDWKNVKRKIIIRNLYDIKIFKNIRNNLVYILWGYGSDPVIRTDLQSAIDNIEYINDVGCDQWFYNLEDKYIIEFYHDDGITLGWAEK